MKKQYSIPEFEVVKFVIQDSILFSKESDVPFETQTFDPEPSLGNDDDL